VTAHKPAAGILKTCLSVLYRGAILPVRDFIYPPVCLTCDAMLAGGEERVCARCWNSIPGIEPGHPVWTELAAKLRAEGVVQDLLSCYLFEKEGKLQEILHLLKYKGMSSLGELLGREVGKRMLLNPEFRSPDSLIPVPLNKLKQRERGYNQADAICRGISAETRIRVEGSLLIRRRYTESQTELDRAQRRENVRGAFALSPKRAREVKGRCIVLVDDVITTGSTMSACASELLKNGAERVLAVSAALAA
jgi:ComF family protein